MKGRFFLLLWLPLFAFAYSISPNPYLVIHRTSSPPVIDGSLNDECWQSASWQSAENLLSGSVQGGELSFAILYDDNNIYITAKIKEEKPKVSHRRDEDRVWEDSCLEVFIDNPSPAQPLNTYRHYVVNAEGYKFDEKGNKGSESWNGGWTVKTVRRGGGWDVEMSIPAKDLDLANFKDGLVFPFNICASLYYPSHILLSFSPVKGGFHNPENFSLLALGEKPAIGGELTLSPRTYDNVLPPQRVSLRKGEELKTLSSLALKPGSYAVDVFQGERFLCRFGIWVSYFPDDFGATLHSDQTITVWTADPMYNVFKEQAPPQRKADKIFIFACRNEWEPFQIIFHPSTDIADFHLRVSDLRGPSLIPGRLVDIYKVEYVPITIPTDPDGKPGDYPDPLVKVEGGVYLEGGRNHPFWLELCVPSDAKPGLYKGEVVAYSGTRKLASLPLELRVFDFSLPIRPDGFHIHTAYGMDVNLDYHKAKPEDREKILPYYLKLLADHHISPYNPFAYPIKYALNPSQISLSNGELNIAFPKAGSTIAKLSIGGSNIANLNFCLDQREGEAVGWPGVEKVKPEVVINGPLRCKIMVKGEKVSSSIANRAYETLEEIEVFAGQRWISRRLLSLKSADQNPYSIYYYFLLLSPAQAGAEPFNGADWSAWKVGGKWASCFALSPGQFGFAFRIDAGGGAHGDITREVNLEVKEGEEAIREAQPRLYIALVGNEKEMRAIKDRLSHPLDVKMERRGKDVVLHIKETAGLRREGEVVVVNLGEIVRDWRYARAWQGKREIPSQLDGEELTLLVDLPARGEIEVLVKKSTTPWKGKGLVMRESPPSVDVDFSSFAPSARYALDKLGFSDYNICSALDMGWLWRNESITEEEKRLYAQLGKKVEDFLRSKGWLRKAYCYWFDEPEEKDYPFVIKGMRLLKATFPNVRRLLTEQPEQALYHYVDLWVPIFHLYNEERCKERQRAGQEVWWYVCTGPRHPYPNNFIDYPGIEHRIRLWMNWRYGVTGDLYWSTTYWHKNPWQTPMSYTPDDKGMWGNGDGYLLYPPERGEAREKAICGPVPSMRMKLIREGIEDAEYLWMLQEKVAKMKNPSAEAVEALKLARSLVPSQTEFCRSPEELQAVRLKVATALEKLSK